MQKFYVTPQEIELIQKVIEENKIVNSFELLQENHSGIGSTLDVEFYAEVNGRQATIRIPITTSENW
jgi:hypothetical protein